MATQVTHPAEQESIDTSRFECIDGQLIERPLPTIEHSRLQHRLSVLLDPMLTAQNRHGGPELSVDRTPGSRSDWMTPDFAVSMPGGYTRNQNGHALPPVFLVVEVFFAGQTFMNLRWKAERYIEWGVQHVWFLDHESRSLLSYAAPDASHGHLLSKGSIEIRNVISLPLSDIFA